MPLFEQFKIIMFPQNITKTLSATPGEPEDTFEQALEASASQVKRTGSFVGALKIIPEQDIARAKDKFMEDTEHAYEEAIARHRNISTTSIPFPMWVALAWFASDNIMNWLSSPILFYPICILVGILVILFQLGILPILIKMGMPMVKDQVNGLA